MGRRGHRHGDIAIERAVGVRRRANERRRGGDATRTRGATNGARLALSERRTAARRGRRRARKHAIAASLGSKRLGDEPGFDPLLDVSIAPLTTNLRSPPDSPQDETQDKLDYVLALDAETFLERRLQTLVFKLGLAKSVHHARVLIRQRHIRVGKQIVNVPSFLVRTDSQKHIDFALNSPLGGGRPGRVKRKRQAAAAGGGDDAEEEDE